MALERTVVVVVIYTHMIAVLSLKVPAVILVALCG